MKIINTIKNLFSGKTEKETTKKTITTKKAGRAKKAKALDFFKFTVGDKDTRYFLNGVYHEEGFKIATNGRILVMVKSDYEEKFEKVILHKSLVPIEGNFPNYKRIIPDFSKMHKIDFDFMELKKNMKENEGVIKIAKKEDSKFPFIYKMPNGCLMSYENLQKLIHFMECYPDSKVYAFEDNKKMLAFVSGKTDSYNALLLVMPLCEDYKLAYIGNIGFQNHAKTENEILRDCKQLEILKRKDYGTMTEKDTEFLNNVHKYLELFKKEAT